MAGPVITSEIPDVRAVVAVARENAKRIGLVPTMGALHEGHASLIRSARTECELVVVSIFVNPTQFGPNEDLDRYPRTLDSDFDLCRQLEVDLVFCPVPATVYPPNFRTYIEVHGLQDALCGASRPNHFRGVCTIVMKLFQIVEPDVVFFGQKDAQQALILSRMVEDLNVPVTMRIMPTVREPDGLALSSRNRFLGRPDRTNAPRIIAALRQIESQIQNGNRDSIALEADLKRQISSIPNAKVDYARIVDAATLDSRTPLQGRILIAVAVWMGETRLIDNIVVELPNSQS